MLFSSWIKRASTLQMVMNCICLGFIFATPDQLMLGVPVLFFIWIKHDALHWSHMSVMASQMVVSWVLVLELVQVNINNITGNLKAPHYWLTTGGFSQQRGGNVESVSNVETSLWIQRCIYVSVDGNELMNVSWPALNTLIRKYIKCQQICHCIESVRFWHYTWVYYHNCHNNLR